MGLGIVIVEVCNSNSITRFDLDQLEIEFHEATVIRMECLNICGMCRVGSFALVNGKRVFAKTVERCIELIKEKIAEELAAFNEMDNLF